MSLFLKLTSFYDSKVLDLYNDFYRKQKAAYSTIGKSYCHLITNFKLLQNTTHPPSCLVSRKKTLKPKVLFLTEFFSYSGYI